MKKVELPVDEVRAMVDAGHSYREVAERYGCSVGRVAAFAREQQLSPPQRAASASIGSRRGPGRPRPETAPNVRWHEIDRDLVDGQLVESARGVERRFKSYRELAEEHGISHTLVARYAVQHRCIERRQERLAGGTGTLDVGTPTRALVPASRPPLSERKKFLQHRILDRIESDLDEGRVPTHIFSNIVNLLEGIADETDNQDTPESWAANLLARIAERQPVLLEQRRIALANPAVTGSSEPAIVITEDRVTLGPRPNEFIDLPS